MNREIKFRAMDKQRKQFFYGSYIKTDIDVPAIVFGDGEQVEIDKETLGQLTGLTDCNGVQIYEGDIVKFTSPIIRLFASNKKDMYPGKLATTYKVVEYRNDSGAFCWKDSALTGLLQKTLSKYGELAGNIFENPELLEQN